MKDTKEVTGKVGGEPRGGRVIESKSNKISKRKVCPVTTWMGLAGPSPPCIQHGLEAWLGKD